MANQAKGNQVKNNQLKHCQGKPWNRPNPAP